MNKLSIPPLYKLKRNYTRASTSTEVFAHSVVLDVLLCHDINFQHIHTQTYRALHAQEYLAKYYA